MNALEKAAVLLCSCLFAVLPLPGAAYAVALDAVAPGAATSASLAAELGSPVEVSDNTSIPVERFEAPAGGVRSVTAWFDDEGTLKYARVTLVKEFSPETAAILFAPSGAVRMEEGNAFSGAEDGRTEHYDGDGVHFHVMNSTVAEIWRTLPGADVAGIRIDLDGNAKLYTLVAVQATAPDPETVLQADSAITQQKGESGVVAEPPAQRGAAAANAPAWLGVDIRALTDDEAKALEIANGVYVVRVAPGSPAGKSGILAGDVIIAVDKTPAASPEALSALVSAHKSGDFVTVHFVRAGGALRATVKLAARTPAPGVPSSGPAAPGGLGFLIQPVTEEIAKANGLSDTCGALVSQVIKNSPAEKAGITAGDIIISFDGQKVLRIEHLRQILSATAPGTSVKIEIIRDGQVRVVDAVVGELK